MTTDNPTAPRRPYSLGWSDGQTQLVRALRDRLAALRYSAPALHSAIIDEINAARKRASIVGAIESGDLTTKYVDALGGEP